jgi:aerobic C4-dicarboxylate transport protein
VPIESLAILVGIDRFMSECRALVNIIENGIATVVVSLWEKELTREELNAKLLKPKSLADITSSEIEAELEAEEKSASLQQPHS